MRISSITKNAGKACNNRLYRHIRTFEKIVKNYFVIYCKYYRFLPYGGPDGEMGASMRYLSQRYSMPYGEQKAVLTDIGTEELAHLEIVAAIVHQLTRNLTAEELEAQGFGPYYIDHTTGIWPQAAGGVPFNACEFQSKGDPVTDLFEDLAADGATA